jgi:hypothetical protein
MVWNVITTAVDRSGPRGRVAVGLIAVLALLGAVLCCDANLAGAHASSTTIGSAAVVPHLDGDSAVVHDHAGDVVADGHSAPGKHDDHPCEPNGAEVPGVGPAPVPGPVFFAEPVASVPSETVPGAVTPRVGGVGALRHPPGARSLVLMCVSRR